MKLLLSIRISEITDTNVYAQEPVFEIKKPLGREGSIIAFKTSLLVITRKRLHVYMNYSPATN
jgi:hypothetical protein